MEDVMGEEIARAQTPIIARGRIYVAGFGQVFAFTVGP